MRKRCTLLALWGMISLGVAQAAPVADGSTFNIAGASLCTTTECTFPGPTILASASGSFASAGFVPGTPVVMTNPFIFTGFNTTTVYTSSVGPTTTSFQTIGNISSNVTNIGGAQLVTVVDFGTVFLTGFDPTEGVYAFTANQFGQITGSFSASALAVAEPVSLGVIGAGVLGLGILRRRKNNAPA